MTPTENDSTSTANEGRNKCNTCDRVFGSYAGLRQHMRLKHSDEYNRELELASTNSRQQWTQLEIEHMAREEAKYGPLKKGLLDHLAKLIGRTKEAVKGRRRYQVYRDLVQSFLQTNSTNSDEIASLNTSMTDTSPSESLNSNSASQNLLEHINNIPGRDDEDNLLIAKITDETMTEKSKHLEKWLKVWITPLVKPLKTKTPQVSNNPTERPTPSRRKKRVTEFRKNQRLFNIDKRALLDKIIKGEEFNSKIIPPLDEIKREYEDIFCQPSPEDPTPISYIDSSCNLSTPITLHEINWAINTSKSSSTGPDGIKLDTIKSLKSTKLELLFNIMLFLQYTPDILKISRTTLIPKTNDCLHITKNWRPISISCIIMRIFNRIWSKRFKAITLNPMQRGFSDIDGCLANNLTLQSFIKNSRKKAKPHVVISLDLQKAFDRVSHNSIKRALRRLRIDEIVIDTILSAYKDASTIVSINNIKIATLKINRGVKQGDPLSPFLFNAVLDEVLQEVNKSSTPNCNVMAYADDMIITATSVTDAKITLNHTTALLSDRNLIVNPEKCFAFAALRVPKKKKLFITTTPSFSINGVNLPNLGVDNIMKYLGIKYSAFGVVKTSSKSVFENLNNLKSAALKPFQKMFLLQHHLIPRYISTFQQISNTSKLLKSVDKSIRWFIKNTIHFPSSCSNHIFYAPRKDGGLGIFEFNSKIPVIMRDRIERIKNQCEIMENVINETPDMISSIKRLIKPHLASKEDIIKHHSYSLEISFSGNGIGQCSSTRASTFFIYTPPVFWNGEEYIRAMQLRYNLLPCKSMPSVPPDQRRCRAGCAQQETVCHILQKCPRTHAQRILRHDYVVQRLRDIAKKKGWTVNMEQHIRLPDGSLKKPDLILSQNGVLLITDIGISWEGPRTLAETHTNKNNNYNSPEFLKRIEELFPGKSIYVESLIVGARGIWCINNNTLAQLLDLSLSDIKEIILSTLRGSWTIHREFMKMIWR